jgi:hypothetical protein
MNKDEASYECARYILDSELEQIDYRDFVEEGNDPRDHIFYSAAVILEIVDQLQDDIDKYLKTVKSS